MAEPDTKFPTPPGTPPLEQPPAPEPSQSSQPFQSPQPSQTPQPPLDGRITLRVRDENENEFAFMMKRSTAFKKIFDAFAHKVGARVRTFRFHFEGRRLAEEDSPERHGLADDDLIEAFVLAEGG